MSSEKDLEREAASLRRVAFMGVALSTTATLICVLSVPLLYNYLQHTQSRMQSEVCQLWGQDLVNNTEISRLTSADRDPPTSGRR